MKKTEKNKQTDKKQRPNPDKAIPIPPRDDDGFPDWLAFVIIVLVIGLGFLAGYATKTIVGVHHSHNAKVEFDHSKYYQDGVDTVGWEKVLQIQMPLSSRWHDAWQQDEEKSYQSQCIPTRQVWHPKTKPRLREWVIPKLTQDQALQLTMMLNREQNEKDNRDYDLRWWTDDSGVVHFSGTGICICPGTAPLDSVKIITHSPYLSEDTAYILLSPYTTGGIR